MNYSDYTWLRGPALHTLLMLDGVRAGDLLHISGSGLAPGEPSIKVVVGIGQGYSWGSRSYVKVYYFWFDSGSKGWVRAENIRAWCRPPLDLELT